MGQTLVEKPAAKKRKSSQAAIKNEVADEDDDPYSMIEEKTKCKTAKGAVGSRERG